ncbi:hypothetical protein PF010_g12093 [Phytophthora fragariae]|uniref:CCHC-type domain-containing protein n=1 Tax=Phytophthora fragariae TaxID=53985 RepID=A0A6G0L3R8_9STRA|nr:hypothetical protein PF010_g12093 [Phytophthora fragariae]KAE9246610.1 hypothetical protein PF004_g4707 [Phytophthora fragariae]
MSMVGGSGNTFRSGAGNGWKNDGGNWHNNGAGGNRPNGNSGSGLNGGTGGGKKPIKKCYHCKKAGHLRRDCWHYKNKSLKGHGDGHTGSKKSNGKQNKKSEVKQEVSGIINHMQWLNNGGGDSSSDEDDKMIGMVQKTVLASDSMAWMLDLGSTTHVCIDRSRFVTEKKSRATFKVWTGDVTRGVMSGTVPVLTRDDRSSNPVELSLENVEYSPHGSTNLLSLGVMEKTGWSLSANSPQEQELKLFIDHGNVRLIFAKQGSHYWLKTVDDDVPTEEMAMLTVNADASPLMRWHERRGHLNVGTIKHMMDNGTVTGMDIPKELFKKKFVSLSCMSTKQKRRSYNKCAVEKRTNINYERLRSDTGDMGKYLPGLTGFRYFQLIQDEGSRYKWCFPLKKKSDGNVNTIKLMTELLAQGHWIKTFSSDGGGEFDNRTLVLFCEARGIKFVPTHPYTPEENALIKKLNGVLVSKMRADMHAADLPNRLWPEVLQYIVDIDNMSAARALNGKTPSEKWLGKVADVSKIRVCGSVGFIHEPKQKRKTKLSPMAEPALLQGFAQRSP